MKSNYVVCIIGLLSYCIDGFGQGTPPWESPLKIVRSSDGITFNTPDVFQDSAGVPNVIRWKGDTLIAAFQWFRLPNPSPTWDRVAVKFSFDNGLSWAQPVPININGFPMNYQRPFDPTLAVFGHDSLRIYFSSSIGQPTGGLDSSVNTYSARSADGINYFFESGSRVDEPVNRVIDPAVVSFNNAWHYLSPIGSPQQGAYHYVSPDGINFSAVPTIPSDNLHNWTGNYMIESNSELRFYGCGSSIWCNSTPNGGQWMGYVNTNVVGGDPSVLKIAGNDYLMIYVGQPYSTSTVDEIPDNSIIQVYPNPVKNMVQIKCPAGSIGTNYFLFDETGKMVLTGKIESESLIVSIGHLKSGIYLFSAGENKVFRLSIMKE